MRKRDTKRWGIGRLYPDEQFFLENVVEDGLHTIQVGAQYLDLLVRDRGAPVTVVSFHHRVSERTAYPNFVAETITRECDVNLIALSDPSVALSNRVRLGWYLGNKAIGDLRTRMTPIVQHCLESLRSSRTIFFGNSGGGYAAVNFAQDFPHSVALAVNPTLSFPAEWESDVSPYLIDCQKAQGRTPYKRLRDTMPNLGESLAKGTNFDLAIYQNRLDFRFHELQFKPFISQIENGERLWVSTPNDGEGHLPIPREKLKFILRQLGDPSISPEAGLATAHFNKLSERERAFPLLGS